MPSQSSRRWLKEHFSDSYVKKAQQAGYRSRAVYKLLEIQERDRLFKPGMVVIDLGAAPGGFSELVKEYVGEKGRVIALDILAMKPIPGIEFIQGDFSDADVLQQLLLQLGETKVDWVISDMSPNMSGIESVDQARSMALVELALDFSQSIGGGFLVKVFQGEGSEAFLKAVRQVFKKVVIRKPKASRGRSREIYVLARN